MKSKQNHQRPVAKTMPSSTSGPSPGGSTAETGEESAAGQQAHDGQQLPQKRQLTSRETADLHPTLIAWHVYDKQLTTFVKGEQIDKGTLNFIADTVSRMKPRDSFEEMLIYQSIWTHARIARLSLLANQQEDTKPLQVVSEACERAANTFRRQMLAFAEYRRPSRSDAFMAIKQANLAQQQVVQNVENSNSQKSGESNEKGFIPSGGESPALPSHSKWSGFPANGDSNRQAVATDDGTTDGAG